MKHAIPATLALVTLWALIYAVGHNPTTATLVVGALVILWAAIGGGATEDRDA